jgi:hypothetical protein
LNFFNALSCFLECRVPGLYQQSDRGQINDGTHTTILVRAINTSDDVIDCGLVERGHSNPL